MLRLVTEFDEICRNYRLSQYALSIDAKQESVLSCVTAFYARGCTPCTVMRLSPHDKKGVTLFVTPFFNILRIPPLRLGRLCALQGRRCPFVAAGSAAGGIAAAFVSRLLGGNPGGAQGVGGGVADGVAHADDAHIPCRPEDGQSGVAVHLLCRPACQQVIVIEIAVVAGKAIPAFKSGVCVLVHPIFRDVGIWIATL